MRCRAVHRRHRPTSTISGARQSQRHDGRAIEDAEGDTGTGVPDDGGTTPTEPGTRDAEA
jgi:hypothetical protein